MDQLGARIRIGMKAAVWGIIAGAALVVVKVVAGILGRSSALVADGIESAGDVLMSIVVWRGLHASGRDATEDFHFGYGKAEPLASSIVSLFMIGSAIAIGIVSSRGLQGTVEAPSWFTLPVLVLVIVVKELLARRIARVGERIGSVAITNDAIHHRTDAITSVAAFIGILTALVGGPDYYRADAIAALFCAAVIVVNAIRMLRGAVNELMDRAPGDEILTTILSVANAVPDVRLVEKVFARKSGLAYFVALHVHADPSMSLHDAHIVSGKVKTAIKRALPTVKDVLVHMEPAEGPNSQ